MPKLLKNCLIYFALAVSIVLLAEIAGSRSGATNPPTNDTPLCYMRTADGRSLQLDSLCGKNDVPATVSNDQAFVEHYQRLVMKSPNMGNTLADEAKTSPESLISQAKLVCEGLQAGISLQEISAAQNIGAKIGSDTREQMAHKVSTDTLDALAVKYYCPNAAH